MNTYTSRKFVLACAALVSSTVLFIRGSASL